MMLALTPAKDWGLLTKRVTPDRVDPAFMPKHFFAYEMPDVREPAEAFKALLALRDMPRVMLIRGGLRKPPPDGTAAYIRRKFLASGDVVGDIMAKPRRLLMLDFDDLGDAMTVAEGLDRAVQRLPPEIAQGQFIGIATSKAKPGAMRLRVATMLSAPASDRDCRTALYHISDTSLYSPVQPHYTADPIFDEGATDPFKGDRVAYLTLPGQATISRHEDLSGEAMLALESACKRIAAAKEGNRHTRLNQGAFRMGTYGEHAPADAQNRLYQAALAAGMPPDRARDEMTRGWNDGLAKPAGEDSWQSRLERGQTGRRLNHEVNARIVLANDPRWRDRVGYSKATCAIEWMDAPPNVAGAVEPAHLGQTSEEVYSRHGIAFSTQTLHRAICGLASDNSFDPKREWLFEQPYDGGSYIETAFQECFGVPADSYSIGVARNLMLGLARRVLYPGCQHDEVTVLEGDEGLGKSTFFRTLAGEWHGEIKNLQTDDYVQLISRVVVAELAEMSAMRRVDDERFKQVVTSPFDLYRPKYAIGAVAHPRSCVFVGTVNPPQGSGRYLTSRTGNRRFLPLYIARPLDKAIATELLPLCIGEARERVLAGEQWAPVPGAKQAQEAREVFDPLQDSIAEVTTQVAEITLGHLCAVLDIPPERRHSTTYTRMETCLHRLGWTLTNKVTKQRARLWAKPNTKEIEK